MRIGEILRNTAIAGGLATIGTVTLPVLGIGRQELPEDACTPGQKVFQLEVDTGDGLRDNMIRLHEIFIANPAYGGYLELSEDGKTGILSDCPQVVPVEFIPHFSTTSIYRSADIPIYRNPSTSSTKSHQIRPQEIMTRSGVLVFGRKIPEYPTITVEYRGETYEGSTWAMLADRETSEPIFPTKGRVLAPKEGAYYVPGDYFVVRK